MPSYPVFGAAAALVLAAPILASQAGISGSYAGDIDIEGDPAVVFVERFDEPTLKDLFARWTDVKNPGAMTFSPDVPADDRLSQSLEVRWIGGSQNGGHLYKMLAPGIDDTLYLRYYIKYPLVGRYRHDGVEMGGYNPPSSWPIGGAGSRPTGTNLFSASAEQTDDTTRFDHYDYWVKMRPDGKGDYWGNTLLNDPAVTVAPAQWTCIEHMVKLNDSPTSSNGEHAIWINGIKVSHLGPGFPKGLWTGGNFKQTPKGSPFEGFQWRTTPALNLNWLWLEVYAPDAPRGSTGSIKYAHVVAATRYIGCF
jgi:hypothetical protein